MVCFHAKDPVHDHDNVMRRLLYILCQPANQQPISRHAAGANEQPSFVIICIPARLRLLHSVHDVCGCSFQMPPRVFREQNFDFFLLAVQVIAAFLRGFLIVTRIVFRAFFVDPLKLVSIIAGHLVQDLDSGLGITIMITSAAKVERIQQSGGIFLILSALINIWYIIRLKQA